MFRTIGTLIIRELEIMRKRPIYLLGSVFVIAFCSIFFLSFFKDGLPSNLPIGVVDMDNTSASRNFSRQLDATQLGQVVYFKNITEAREAMMSGDITSFCILPKGMYNDIISNRQPTISFYINSLYFVGGALAYKDLLTMINLTNGSIQRQVLRAKGENEETISGIIRPFKIDTHQIGNPYTNYGYYLINTILPGILEMIIIIILIYSLGMELKYGTSKNLMEKSGNSIFIAITGKLIVYTFLFSLLGIFIVFLLYHIMHFPMYGSIWNMVIAILMLVFASEGIAIFILSCLPVPRLALSIGALYSVMALSLSGFTLPTEAMPDFIQGISVLFPLRHYYIIFVKNVIYAQGIEMWWQQIVYLICFMILPFTMILRLKNAYINQNFPKE